MYDRMEQEGEAYFFMNFFRTLVDIARYVMHNKQNKAKCGFSEILSDLYPTRRLE